MADRTDKHDLAEDGVSDDLDYRVRSVAISLIVPNMRQPRRRFGQPALQELAESIRQHGVLQPLLIRALGDGRYELIAGERRLRASKLAGLECVPAIIRSTSSETSLEIALIENIQREDISSLECAHAYRRLIEEFGLTQDEIARKVGKARATIANTIRLLQLPPTIQNGLTESMISDGHARALLAIRSPQRQIEIYRRIVEKGLTVRQVEALSSDDPMPVGKRTAALSDPNDDALEDALSKRFGSLVSLKRTSIGGRIEIEFHDEDDLERIVDAFGVTI